MAPAPQDAPQQAPEQPKQQHKSVLQSSTASAISGLVSGSLISACVQPLDVIRTKMQGDLLQGVRRTMVGTAAEVIRAGGVQGLWLGTSPSVIRVGAGAGLHFVLLEQLKHLILTLRPRDGREDGRAPRLAPAEAAMAGGLSRAVAAVVTCPITVVKTRMEYARTGPAAAAGGAAAAAAGTAPAAAGAAAVGGVRLGPQVYRNTAHALYSIARSEGVGGLFRGLTPTVLTNAPFSGLYYMFYSQLKEGLHAPDRPQAMVNFVSGCLAAAAATVLTQPADVVRTQMQLGFSGGATSLGALSSILTHQGAAALMTGVGPRFLKRTAQTALVWTLYEELMPRLSKLLAPALADSSRSSSTSDVPGQQQRDGKVQDERRSRDRRQLSAFVEPLTAGDKVLPGGRSRH